MRNIAYSPSLDRLVYVAQRASPEFWDEHWRREGAPTALSRHDEILVTTSRYLRRGARVLEGGCGRGDKVNALAAAGFDAVGVDYAEDAVQQARNDFPGLDIRVGDVRALPFPDQSFDGYWSVGVIEHFWEGYDAILAEAARVLRIGAVLFLTAPWLSPYRRRKLRAGGYPVLTGVSEPENFFQFALSRQEVAPALQRQGFELLHWRGVAAATTLLEEVTVFRAQIDWLLKSRGRLGKRLLRRMLLQTLGGYCGHSFMAVARRRT
jgi:SAM-dependent methyltransferase